MPQPQIIINRSGPLPLAKGVTTASKGPAMLIVAGSVYSTQENTLIGIEVLLDGQAVGVAPIYSNGASTHRAVVPQHIPVNLDKEWPSPGQPPTYNITIQAMNANTISDTNDYFQVVLNA